MKTLIALFFVSGLAFAAEPSIEPIRKIPSQVANEIGLLVSQKSGGTLTAVVPPPDQLARELSRQSGIPADQIPGWSGYNPPKPATDQAQTYRKVVELVTTQRDQLASALHNLQIKAQIAEDEAAALRVRVAELEKRLADVKK